MNFQVTIKRDGQNSLFINIKDAGFKVVDSLDNIPTPQILIKNDDAYIVSEQPFISLCLHSLDAVNAIKNILNQIYRNTLFINDYFYEDKYYLIAIYKNSLQDIMNNCVFNNPLFESFIENKNLYFCISTRFSNNSISNSLNGKSISIYSKLSEPYYNFTESQSNTEIVNFNATFDLNSKYQKSLNNLIKNQASFDDISEIRDLLKFAYDKHTNVLITAENGIKYSINDIVKLMQKFIKTMKTKILN